MTEEAKTISANTNLMVHQQGEQLQRINDKTKDINGMLDNSEEKAKEIDSYWYYLKSKLKRALGFGRKTKNDGSLGGEIEDEPEEKVEKKQGNTSAQEPQSAEDEALDGILQDLTILKKDGKTLGKALDKQIKTINEIDRGVDRANTTTTNVNGILRKILR